MNEQGMVGIEPTFFYMCCLSSYAEYSTIVSFTFSLTLSAYSIVRCIKHNTSFTAAFYYLLA